MTRVLKRFSHRYKENWVEIKINAFFVARFCFFAAWCLFAFWPFSSCFALALCDSGREGEKSNSFYRDLTRAGQE